jgi:hypothetical protein
MEWQFADPTINKSHPNGYEWCVNDAAVDQNGTVYGDDEDGNLYAIQQGGVSSQRIFLKKVEDAGYTPLSMGGDGTVYTLNYGHFISAGQLASTVTAITSSLPNPSTYGTTVTFNATVTASSGTPTGTVAFYSGKTSLGSAPLVAGAVTFSTAQLNAGSDSITAKYSGDARDAASASQSYLQTVNKATTTVSLTSSPNPSTQGQTVTFTATVTSTVTPTGNVIFKDGTSTLATVPLTSGTALYSTNSLASGKHNIKATFQSNSNFLTSAAQLVQNVQ